MSVPEILIVKKKVRKNGFERPFSVFQLLSWVIAAFIFVSFVLTALCMLLNRSEGPVDTTHTVVTCVLVVTYLAFFAAMIVTTAIVTASDPTDPTVELERSSRSKDS